MDPPAGTVAIAFVEVEGASARLAAGDARFTALFAELDRRLRHLLDAHAGFLVKSTPGGFMLAFAEAEAALRFALALQESLDGWDGAAETPLAIGIHLGEPILERDPATGRADYLGPVVNRAARIAAAGHGGQILLSGAAFEGARPALGNAAASDLGEHRLRGIDRPETIVQVLPGPQRDRRFPPLRTLSALPTNLPSQTTTFVGREREIREVAALVSAEPPRPVALTGTAGVGKSRLAVRVASELLDRFEGGCWHADVSEARDAAGVAASVAHALGVPLAGKGDPVDLVAAVLEFRKPLLIVLDGFEPVVSEAPSTVGVWAQRAPQVRWLIASRALPVLPGLVEFRLLPLDAPPRAATVAQIAACGAVRLFVDRAREARPGFELTDRNAAEVAEICSELEGLPLALELAAARVKIMQPTLMVKKLAQKFQLLRSSRQDAAPRQQTLTAALDWSYDLLSPWEQSALRQASVFRGGMTPAAADAVIDLARFPGAPRGADAMAVLVSRSLAEERDSASEKRFRLSRTIRQYAEGRASDIDGAPSCRELEARHGAAVVGELEKWQSRGRTDDLECLDRQQADLENALVAHDRAIAAGDVALAARAILAVTEILSLRGPAVELARRLEAAIAGLRGPAGGALLVHLLLALGSAQRNFGQWGQAAASSAEAVERARPLGDAALLARALVHEAAGAGFSGKYEDADRLLDEADRVLGGRGALETAEIENARGATLVERGDHERALGHFAKAAPLFRAAGSRHGLLLIHSNSAAALIHIGDLDLALQACEAGERLAVDMGNRAMQAVILDHRGGILSGMGDFAGALGAFGRAADLNRELGRRRGFAINLAHSADCWIRTGDLQKARSCAEESEAVFKSLGDPRSAANVRGMLGNIVWKLGDAGAGLRLMDDACAYFRKLGDPFGLFTALNSRGGILHELGRDRESRADYLECVEAARSCGATKTLEFTQALAGLAEAEAGSGNAEEAARVARQALADARTLAEQYRWRGADFERVVELLKRLAGKEE